MPISPFPTPAPSRSDSADVFVTRADATIGHFSTFTTEANQLQSDVNSAAAGAGSDSTNAAAAAVTAESHANTAASSANFKGSWSSLAEALTVPASVLHNSDFWQLINNLADVTLSEPGVNSSDWAYISSSSALPAENLYLHSIYGGL